MTERDEYDEIAIRTEAETTPSTALSASDKQTDRRLLARDIAFALSQHAATKRCASCKHWITFPRVQRGRCEFGVPVYSSTLNGPDNFGCTLFAPQTPDREG